MPAKSANAASQSTFYQKVDRDFYDQVAKENGGQLPADLVDSQGNPRKLTTGPQDSAYRKKWKAIAAKDRNSKAVPNKEIQGPCIPCALKAAAAKIPPIKLPAKKDGKPTSVPAPRTQNQAPKSPAGQVKEKPCNLQMLSLVEPKAVLGDKPGTRRVQIQKQAERQPRVCPTMLESGSTFQITANSKYNPPRQVTLEAATEAVCGAKHPVLHLADSTHNEDRPSQQATLSFSRSPMGGEEVGELPGFWPVLNSVFHHGTEQFAISADCCGQPAKQGGDEVASLAGNIEVFPGDQYSLEIKLPALLKPELLSYETSTSGWVTEKDLQKKEVKAAGDEAAKLYKSSDELQDIGSEKEFKQFAEDLTKKKLGIEDEQWQDQLEVKLTQTDGTREYEAPVQDLIKLVRMILSAEYAFKQIQDWVENFQVGPGVRFKIECQFLAGTLKAQWGYTEFLDDRVFFAYKGSVKLDLIRAKVDVSIGWRTAGLADLLIVLKGDGSISLNIPEIAKKDPDEEPERSVLKPEGELKFSGSLEGTVCWVVKASAGLECTFKAETEEFKLFADDCILGGKMVISREPVYAVFSYSKGLWGGTVTEKEEVIKGNPHLAEFDFS